MHSNGFYYELVFHTRVFMFIKPTQTVHLDHTLKSSINCVQIRIYDIYPAHILQQRVLFWNHSACSDVELNQPYTVLSSSISITKKGD